MSLSKQSIIDDIIRTEGSYVNNSNDLGGETNYGITVGTANQYRNSLVSQFNWDGTMRNLTIPMAEYIYDQFYWQPLKLDTVFASCPKTAYVLFDIGVNCGTARAGIWLQNLLNALNQQGKIYADISADGQVGPGTMNAFSSLVKFRGLDRTDTLLETGLLCTQGNYYIQISLQRGANEEFTAGWLTRVANSISYATT